MANFHYKHIKSQHGKNATSIYSDTDSLIYLSITDDVYEDMIQDNDMFDFSEYPLEHELYKMNIIRQDGQGKNIIKNCEVPGKFKEDNSSNVCKKWWCVELNLMQKNLFLLLMKKVKFMKSIRTQERECHHILFKKNTL